MLVSRTTIIQPNFGLKVERYLDFFSISGEKNLLVTHNKLKGKKCEKENKISKLTQEHMSKCIVLGQA